MTETPQFLQPSNKFIVEAKVELLPHQLLQLYRYLNLHYLGDIDANHSVDGVMVPKYPEKETEEFKKALHNANSSYAITLSMEFDVNGQPNIKAVLEGVASQ